MDSQFELHYRLPFIIPLAILAIAVFSYLIILFYQSREILPDKEFGLKKIITTSMPQVLSTPSPIDTPMTPIASITARPSVVVIPSVVPIISPMPTITPIPSINSNLRKDIHVLPIPTTNQLPQ
mgnify:CR=1 FL=1